MIPNYTTPEEAATAATGETDMALGYVIGQLARLMYEKRSVRNRLMETDDEDESTELAWLLRQLKEEEHALHRIESGLQSRLRVP